jgi:transcriptional regulator with XRE-family HTH domain
MANLMSGRQLRAARALAGPSQKDLANLVGASERAVRAWESRKDHRPISAPNDSRVEKALLGIGVEVFSSPSPGVRLIE